MKNRLLVLVTLIAVVLGVVACNAVEGTARTDNPKNAVPPAPNKYLVTVSADDFTRAEHIVRQVEVKSGDTFTIALDSNATTGFSWTEQASIANTEVLRQTGHNYIAPRENNGDTPVVGMAGVEEWTFTAVQTGQTTATLGYSRPWQGGEKDVRTFELVVVVK